MRLQGGTSANVLTAVDQTENFLGQTFVSLLESSLEKRHVLPKLRKRQP
jgi:hypothetical protein